MLSHSEVGVGLMWAGIWAELRGGRMVDSERLGKVFLPACGDLVVMEMRVSSGLAGGGTPFLTISMTREKYLKLIRREYSR